jgi:DNA-binding transcriptional MocR family regulator
VTDPPGGFILWLELPPQVDSPRPFEACLAERIRIGPGVPFSATERCRHRIRLGVGGPWGVARVDALRRVGAIASRMAEAATPGDAPRAPASRPRAGDAAPLHA